MENIAEKGLTARQVEAQRRLYGFNELDAPEKRSFFGKLLHTACEPMFLLLLAAASIYFLLGNTGDGLVMLAFVAAIIGIDALQQWRTDRTLHALKDLSAPRIRVIRAEGETVIPSRELVPGDLMMVSEGVKIPADGKILKSSDLLVDESTLTGEPLGTEKRAYVSEREGEDWRRVHICYAGTLVLRGSALVLVEETGVRTEYGKIGRSLSETPERPTPLQKQTARLVAWSAVLAALLFALVCIVSYFNLASLPPRSRAVESVLSGITVAMAMIPEEFPVILTVFLSLGAWRLAGRQALVRKLPSVETLGAVTVICTDKTGTLTENVMKVERVWLGSADWDQAGRFALMACETDVYDPMEQALISFFSGKSEPAGGKLVREYSFSHTRKMMAHVWERADALVLAAKGAPESILPLCGLDGASEEAADREAAAMAAQGLRVIALAGRDGCSEADLPRELENCRLDLYALIGLADPVRPSVARDIARCTEAGVRVVMITGDGGVTAESIARQAGMGTVSAVTGAEIDSMDAAGLSETVKKTALFSRVVPAHKMRIVEALRANGEIVAMIGDGVNDAPALKSAHIGIAMGKKGSDVAREASDLVLLDDNFSTVVSTIADGRRIYENIRRSVGYVLAIHVPIALSALLAPLMNIPPAALLLLPVHVVLLELVIDPTCSVVLERQPAAEDVMRRPPRRSGEFIVPPPLLAKSLVQGAVLCMAAFGLYFSALTGGSSAEAARSLGITAMIYGSLFLVLVNSSDREPFWSVLKRFRRDPVFRAAWVLTVLGSLAILYTPLHEFLRLAPLPFSRYLLSAAVSFVSVVWYEAVKWHLRRCGAQIRKTVVK